MAWSSRWNVQLKTWQDSQIPPWKLTYPLEIHAWKMTWWNFLSKWSLSGSTFGKFSFKVSGIFQRLLDLSQLLFQQSRLSSLLHVSCLITKEFSKNQRSDLSAKLGGWAPNWKNLLVKMDKNLPQVSGWKWKSLKPPPRRKNFRKRILGSRESKNHPTKNTSFWAWFPKIFI